MPPYVYEEVLRDAEHYDADVFSDFLLFEQQKCAESAETDIFSADG